MQWGLYRKCLGSCSSSNPEGRWCVTVALLSSLSVLICMVVTEVMTWWSVPPWVQYLHFYICIDQYKYWDISERMYKSAFRQVLKDCTNTLHLEVDYSEWQSTFSLFLTIRHVDSQVWKAFNHLLCATYRFAEVQLICMSAKYLRIQQRPRVFQGI